MQGNRNETHNRENSENTKHKGHFSVFENYGVSHPDFELHMRIWYVYNKCGITHLYALQLVIYITRDSMEGKMLLKAWFMSNMRVWTILGARETW